MKPRQLILTTALWTAGTLLWPQSQQSDLILKLTGGTKSRIALPDFRGAGASAALADLFNRTVFEDVQRSGALEMAAKSFYPLSPPQQEADLRLPTAPAPGRGTPPAPASCGGRCLQDWSSPPLNATYIGIGYLAAQGDQLVVFGHLFNATVPDIAGARVFRKLYNGPLTEEGARKVAHEYAADILNQFGVPSLAGSKIYFVSNRGGKGTKEIWVMDFDGANQRPVTGFKSISTMPAVSPDGSRLAFTSYMKGQPRIYVMSLTTMRFLPFLNPEASLNATPSFSPDGTKLLFASSAGGYSSQIYISNADGSGVRRLSNYRAIEVEPKVNPKTGADVAFVSGRGGAQQIYKMNLDGADLVRLTSGEGEAANPAWHPDGQHIVFKWTRGFAPGNWNIFIMDVASKETVQLTHGTGRNENPTWAPDGRHLVFSSNRRGTMQIYTMLADGTEVTPLTKEGQNEMPVWVK